MYFSNKTKLIDFENEAVRFLFIKILYASPPIEDGKT